MKKILLLITMLSFGIILSGDEVLAQNRTIDSLQTLLKKLPPSPKGKKGMGSDTARLNILNKLSWEYINTGDYEKAMQYANEVITIARNSSGENGGKFIAIAYHNIGSIHYSQGNYDKAIEYYIKSITIKGENENIEGMASTYNNIGVIYYVQGNYDKAIEYYIKSLKLYEKIGKKSGMASSYNNIGLIYNTQGNHVKAIEYYLIGLKIEEEFGNKSGVAFSYINIGSIHKDKHEYAKAIEYYIKSLKIFEETGDKKGMAVSYSNIGSLYTNLYKKDTLVMGAIQKEEFTLPRYTLLDSAKHYNLKGYALSREIGDKNTMVMSLAGLGNVLYRKENYKEALHFYERAAALADSIGVKKELYEVYRGLAETHYRLGNGTKAFEYLNMSIALRDTVQREETKENMVRVEMQHEYEKKFAADSVRVAEEKKVVAAQLESEKAQRYGLYGGLVLMFALAGVSYRGYRAKQKANTTITLQKHLVEEKQKEILDSINYAKSLQLAILPPKKLFEQYLPDSFIFYKPKDIVAGDFYWMEVKNEMVFIAAADCTGHGVPGAMVSVVCSNALNRTVKEFSITEPGKILDKVTDLVIETFERSESEVKDGMDISLCCIDKQKNTLQWAGANNPLWIIRQNELIEIKPDKQPIGKFKDRKSFTTNTIDVTAGDYICLFTDGYSDQFGGDKGKKFMTKKFKELLLSIQDKSMKEQSAILEQSFETWKSNYEQVDDVLVIGIRIN